MNKTKEEIFKDLDNAIKDHKQRLRESKHILSGSLTITYSVHDVTEATHSIKVIEDERLKG